MNHKLFGQNGMMDMARSCLIFIKIFGIKDIGGNLYTCLNFLGMNNASLTKEAEFFHYGIKHCSHDIHLWNFPDPGDVVEYFWIQKTLPGHRLAFAQMVDYHIEGPTYVDH